MPRTNVLYRVIRESRTLKVFVTDLDKFFQFSVAQNRRFDGHANFSRAPKSRHVSSLWRNRINTGKVGTAIAGLGCRANTRYADPRGTLVKPRAGANDMLVLTRKVGEQIVVPQCQLTVNIISITGKRVRLGISAPPDVVVHRQEVQQRTEAAASAAGVDLLRSARVLIADPDKYLLTAYSSHLRHLGAAISTARTGLECMERLRDAPPDVLVLEPALLWGGGDGVLALLHEQPGIRPAVVILLTQGRDRSLLYRLSSFRVDDYQNKPLTANQLTKRICTLLASLEPGETVDTQKMAWTDHGGD